MKTSPVAKIFQMAFAAAIVTVLFIGPAHAKRAPDWVNGQSKKYPEPRFFMGVGSVVTDKGGERQQMEHASDRARAEVAKTLRTKVDVDTVSSRTVAGEMKGRKKSSASTSTQTETVRTSASEMLSDVEIKEFFRDKKGKTLYALAVLDRVKAAHRLEEVAELTKGRLLAETEASKSFEAEKRYLPAISHYRTALGLATELRRTNELIGILKPAGPSPLDDMPNYEADISRIMNELKGKIKFTVEVSGPAAKVSTYVMQGLAKAGYISQGGSSASSAAYHLKCLTDLTYKGTIEMGEKLVMQIYQADIDIEVIDPKTKDVMGTITWSVNANEKTQEMAEKSAIRALGRYISEHIADKVAEL